MLSKEHRIVLIIIIGTIILLVVSGLIVYLMLYLSQKQKASIQEKVALHARHAQEMLQTQIEVQNSTLQQIGQELHDNIGQLLSVARINLNILEELDHLPESRNYIIQTNEIIDQSINDLRSLSRSLDGDFVKDFGLEDSLSHELVRIRRTNKFLTDLVIKGNKYTLGHEKDIVVFRIVQEVLNNIIKHSQATSIVSELHYGTYLFTLSLKDNGVGFDVKSDIPGEIKRSGAGLRNMHRRAEMIGATFKLNSKIGEGTIIEIQVPVANS